MPWADVSPSAESRPLPHRGTVGSTRSTRSDIADGTSASDVGPQQRDDLVVGHVPGGHLRVHF
jgi:hypothetical protein